MGRRAGVTGSLGILVLLSAGCLMLPSTPGTQITPNPVNFFGSVFTVDWADPAAVPLSGDLAEVYTTKNFFGNVPSWQTNVRTGGLVGLHDALPTLPSWSNGALVWAPSVRWIDGRYLMFFSASRNGGANCIGAAIASTPDGAFTPMDVHWCGPPDTGYLDPYLFVGADGTPSVLFSVQLSASGGSFIVDQRLTTNGLGFVGPARILLTFGDARAIAGGGNLGSSAFVENPAVVPDPYDGYDLMASVGTWNETAAYTSVQLPCSSIAPGGAPCDTGRGSLLVVDGAYRPGSVSMLTDQGPTGNQAFFTQLVGSGATAHRNVFVVGSFVVNSRP